MDYKDPLFLPTTDFAMRGALPQNEPARFKAWYDERKIYALRILCEKYTPNYMSRVEFASRASLKRMKIYELKIKSVTAKAKIL